jgi:diguanylate cyclase (GGDEF)-like protein
MQHQELNLTDPGVFEHAVEQRIDGAAKSVSVFIVDMSDVNKLFARAGRAASAMFLQSVAKMLHRVCRDGDVVCRIGECTFGIILENVDTAVMQQLAAEKIIRLYEAAVREMDVSYKLRIGIGIAGYPQYASSGADLVHKARMALESAASNGDPYHVYSPDSHETLSLRWSVQDDLAKAIEQGDFELVFQPKISVATGRPVGAEALLRWSHPVHGAVPPTVFVPLACDLGMIDKLTMLVLTTAVEHATQWPDFGLRPSVAVNFEAQMLESPEFVDVVRSSLSIWGDEKVDLIVEITESDLLVDSKSNFQRLNQLRSMGIGVSVDDFGTGYSSLSYFRDIPATELKIDQSFVRNVQDCDRNLNLVETIISIAHRFGMTVVAEGVETEAEFELLKRLNCDLVQGFFFCEPVKQAEFCAWLAKAGAGKEPESRA